jgi:site-specific DNA-methyltransferase (adenine-specific)
MQQTEFQNTLYTNDNLFILSGLNSNLVDLIYLDPPFNSKRMYSAPIGSRAAGSSFKDMWTWQDVNEGYLETLAKKYLALTKFIAATSVIHSNTMAAYLTYMAQRLVEMHRILKDTGSLYLHCDPTASHYLKVLLDEIFGRNNFRNEIVWCYTGPGSPKMKQFNRKHDIILWYSKGKNWTFNKNSILLPYKDGTPHSGGFTEKDGGRLVPGEYTAGKVPETWWTDIALAVRSKKENTGYPTQKPLALLKRIIEASSNAGDIVMDPFCGCATTCVAAQQLDRKWIGIDIEQQAVKILIERLSDDAGLFKDFVHTKLVPQRTDVQVIEPVQSVKERLYREQNGICNGCKEHFSLRNMEIDHIVPKSKGGGSYYENYQLLCGACNKKKGDRPMEYLRFQMAREEELLAQKITFGE